MRHLRSAAAMILFALGQWPLVARAGMGDPVLAPGERAPSVTAVLTDGTRKPLASLLGHRGMILVTWDQECPVSQRYARRLLEFPMQGTTRGITLTIVDVSPHSIAESSAAAKGRRGWTVIHDGDKSVATALGARSTAEAFYFDAKGTLRYRGAIDDQYGIEHQRAKVTSAWLRDAIEWVSKGQEPRVTQTPAKGCPLALRRSPEGRTTPLTYHNRISRLIQRKCQACHRVGGLGPMPLENYRQVFDRRAVIDLMVGTDRMPPWSANPKIGDWANDRSLSAREKADLLAWIKAGAPEGDPKDAPLPQSWVRGWNIGKPDYVLSIPESFKVPAQGAIDYKYVFAKTDFAEDRWITAIEIKPTQPKVVHHVLAFLEEPGRKPLSAEEIARLKPGDKVRPLPSDSVSGFFAATVPGSLGMVFPDGTGKRLPKGAWIKFEIHYQPNGTEVVDRTQIGFKFAPKPLREVESRSAFNMNLSIPPNAPRHPIRAAYTFPKGGQLVSFFPHMHLRGTAFRYDLKTPDGKVRSLLDVPKFDFNWQSYYELRNPVDVPAGSQILATAWYDNSRNNPWNPDPSKTVGWGVQTWEEMMIGYFDFIEDR